MSFILTWCWWCSCCLLLPHTALDWCTHVALALMWAAAGPKEWTRTQKSNKSLTTSTVSYLRILIWFVSILLLQWKLQTLLINRQLLCPLIFTAADSLVSLTYLESVGSSLQRWMIGTWAGDSRMASYLFLSMHRQHVQWLPILIQGEVDGFAAPTAYAACWHPGKASWLSCLIF